MAPEAMFSFYPVLESISEHFQNGKSYQLFTLEDQNSLYRQILTLGKVRFAEMTDLNGYKIPLKRLSEPAFSSRSSIESSFSSCSNHIPTCNGQLQTEYKAFNSETHPTQVNGGGSYSDDDDEDDLDILVIGLDPSEIEDLFKSAP